MTRTARGRTASILLPILFLLAAPARGQDASLSWAPATPVPGQGFTVVLLLPGVDVRDLTVEAGRGAAGMEFISAASVPVRGDGSAAPGARVELTYLVLAEGELSTGPITVRARGMTRSFEAVRVRAGSSANEPEPEYAAWIAPERVSRYAAFRIAAALPDGRAAELEPFAAPGLSTFEAPGGSLVALAVEPGRVALPRTLPALPGVEFRAAAVEVTEVPASVRASRAVGRFSLRLEPGLTETRAGGAFSFALVLEGSGSLPVVALPALSVEGPSGPLAVADLAVTRRDELRPGPDGFEGSVILDCVVMAREAGDYRASFGALDYLAPGGELRRLAVRPLVLRAEAAVDPAAFAAALGRLEALPAVRSGGSRAAVLARAALAARASGDESGFAFALHAAERALRPFDRSLGAALAAALDAREAALRLPSRPRDVLPPPSALLPAALAPLLAGAALMAYERRRERRRLRFGPALRFRASTRVLACLVLGLLFALALGASLAGRTRDFAVVGPGPVRAVPSRSGGVSFTLDAGAAARVLAREGGWARVSFADARSGWVPDEAAASYGGP